MISDHGPALDLPRTLPRSFEHSLFRGMTSFQISECVRPVRRTCPVLVKTKMFVETWMKKCYGTLHSPRMTHYYRTPSFCVRFEMASLVKPEPNRDSHRLKLLQQQAEGKRTVHVVNVLRTVAILAEALLVTYVRSFRGRLGR